MSTVRGVEDEYQALQRLTDKELVGRARRTIRALNLLDRVAPDAAVVAGELQGTMELARQVQEERRHRRR